MRKPCHRVTEEALPQPRGFSWSSKPKSIAISRARRSPSWSRRQAAEIRRRCLRDHLATATMSGRISPPSCIAYDLAASLFRTRDDYALLAETLPDEPCRRGRDLYRVLHLDRPCRRAPGSTPEAYVDGPRRRHRRGQGDNGHRSPDDRHRPAPCGPGQPSETRRALDRRQSASAGHRLRHGRRRTHAPRAGISRRPSTSRATPASASPSMPANWSGRKACATRSIISGHRASATACAPSRIPRWSKRIAAEGIVLEVCPGSNIAIGVFPRFEAHPFPETARSRLPGDAVIPTIRPFSTPRWRANTRSPGHDFGMDETALLDVTRTAIEAAFVDGETRPRCSPSSDCARAWDSGRSFVLTLCGPGIAR